MKMGITPESTRHYRPAVANAQRLRAFTLVELLVSIAVLAVLLMIITNVISEAQRTWSRTASRTAQFREARSAFDLIVKNLSQATLNTYWDYKRQNPDNPLEAPSRYVRQSELRFVTGNASTLLGAASTLSGHAIFFQAPLGGSDDVQYHKLENLLSGRGYFVQKRDDTPYRPAFLSSVPSIPVRNRFRLMEFAPPPENNMVYAQKDSWVQDSINSGFVRPIAENIIALFISPKVAEDDSAGNQEPTYIAPNYSYDSLQEGVVSTQAEQGSQHMLPPLVEVTLVAVDEASGRRIEELSELSNPLGSSGAAFSLAANYKNDLKTLEAYLTSNQINFRVFSTTVALRGAKWSL